MGNEKKELSTEIESKQAEEREVQEAIVRISAKSEKLASKLASEQKAVWTCLFLFNSAPLFQSCFLDFNCLTEVIRSRCCAFWSIRHLRQFEFEAG